MELLLYGRIGHYEKCVNRIRQHSARSAEEEMAARLLQKLTRGRRGRAESSALASSALAFAATLGAATSMQAAFRGYSFRKTGAGAAAGAGAGGETHKDAPKLSASAARKKTYEQSGLKERVEMEERQERQAERVAFEARNQYKMQSDPSVMEISPPPQVRGGRISEGEGEGGGGGGGSGMHAPPGSARAGSSSRPASGKGGHRPRSGSSGRGQEQAQRDALASLGRGQGRPSSGKGQGQGRPSSGAAQRRPSGAGAGLGRSSGRRQPSEAERQASASSDLAEEEVTEEGEEMDPDQVAAMALQKCAA